MTATFVDILRFSALVESAEAGLSGNRLPAIAGLRYVADYLAPETQDLLLAAVDAHPWQTSADHGVQVYGYHYSHRRREAYRIGELPEWTSGRRTNDRVRDACR